MSKELLPEFVRDKYEVHEWKHACAILKEDFPEELIALVKEQDDDEQDEA